MDRWISCALVVIALNLACVCAKAEILPLSRYVGSEACRDCHVERYTDWEKTLHNTAIMDPRKNPEALKGDFTSDDVNFSPEDVEFIIGGHWYQRYATRMGDDLFVLPKVWSVASHRWETQDHWSWKKKPYNKYCIGCHATRYDPADDSYVEHKIGCEACHGPGRDHAETAGRQFILNPGKLSEDDRSIICASCHVRGTDPSGEYHFAVGYVPGQELDDFYVPAGKNEGETNEESFLRQYKVWQDRLADGSPPSCDICGFDSADALDTVLTVSDYCLSCHQYGEDYSQHTKHPSGLSLECLDCHRKITIATAKADDVHKPEFFKVHRAGHAETNIDNACQDCHFEKTHRELKAVLTKWDHSVHWLWE